MEYKVILNKEEKIKSIREAIRKILRILYVYEKSFEDKNYDYKSYVYAVILYISSFNELIEHELTDVIVNLNSLIINDFEKKQIKKNVFECKSIAEKVLKKIGE